MTINIDFDGTCVTHDFPKVGKSIGAEKVLKRLTDNGHQLILFTMRSDRTEAKPVIDPTIQNVTGKFLTDAVNWFKENNIPLYGIQKNPTQFNWTTSPKSYAELMIDDSALGCPLRLNQEVSERPYADWETIEQYLENMGLLKNEPKKKSRCCGRCDGVNDICHADRICEKHTETGCEICFGER